MREIKFRAYDQVARKWVAEFPSVLIASNEGRPTWQYFLGGALAVVQFTGLLDKNGKEIYEGDVVRDCSHTDLVFAVRWDEERAGYMMPKEFDEEYMWTIAEPTLEVIGNIYENHELLKTEELPNPKTSNPTTPRTINAPTANRIVLPKNEIRFSNRNWRVVSVISFSSSSSDHFLTKLQSPGRGFFHRS